MNDIYLLDKDFLQSLDSSTQREVYARITALDLEENPLSQIEGKVTAGSINIDGQSSVRRTCNLTISTQDVNIDDFYNGLRTKINIEIGLKNSIEGFPKRTYRFAEDEHGGTIYQFKKDGQTYESVYQDTQNGYILVYYRNIDDSSSSIISPEQALKYSPMPRLINSSFIYEKNNYPDIIWFPQGIFLITGFNTSIGISSSTISISGKDKMCLLNGDLGGSFNATIDFGTEETIEYTYTPIQLTNAKAYTSHTYYIYWYFPYYGTFDQDDANNNKYFIKVIRNNKVVYENPVNLVGFQPGEIYYIQTYGLATERYNYRDGVECENLTYYKRIATTNKEKIPLKKIIKEMIHVWGNEPYQNIIINDLDTYGLEQLTYHGDDPLYCLKPVDSSIYEEVHMGGDQLLCYKFTEEDKDLPRIDGVIYSADFENYHTQQTFTDIIAESTGENAFKFASPVDQEMINQSPRSFSWIGTQTLDGGIKPWVVLQLLNGDDAGYHVIDLVYNGDLIAKPGETCTSILDKIKQMLGDYEYFYNLDGQFVFQKKRSYLKTQWTPLSGKVDELKVAPTDVSSPNTYNFEGNKLITSFNNTPSLTSLKNDFTIWGVRKTISDTDIDIHMRYAIDKKPIMYKSIDGISYGSDELADQRFTEYKIYNKREVPEWLSSTEDPENLSASWWYLTDWVEYYKLLTNTNENPPGLLLNYSAGENGFTGNITFPNGETISLTNQLIFDYDIANECPYRTDGWNPFSHGVSSCQHTIEQFLEFHDTRENFVSFIYNPQIPVDIAVSEYSATYLPGGTISLEGETSLEADMIVDWREIIYRMALDYYKYNENPKFLDIIAKNNRYFYPTGYTGYEQYYVDMQGFWRQLYNPEATLEIIYKQGSYVDSRRILDAYGSYETTEEWNQPEIVDINCDYYLTLGSVSKIPRDDEGILIWSELDKFRQADYYGQELPDDCLIRTKENYTKILEKLNTIYKDPTIPEENDLLFWNQKVFNAPETLNFWFDFISSTGDFSAISKSAIGNRTKVINDNKVKSIYYKEIPNFIYYTGQLDLNKYKDKSEGYIFILLTEELDQLFSISYRGKSAKETMDQMIYDYGYGTESITLSTLPIYYLEPNTRILVHDEDSNINGVYLIEKITISLDYKGTMSIQATKLPTAKTEENLEESEYVNTIKQLYDDTDIDFLSDDQEIAAEINEQFSNIQDLSDAPFQFKTTFANLLYHLDALPIGDATQSIRTKTLKDLKIIPIQTASVAINEKVYKAVDKIFIEIAGDPSITINLSPEELKYLELKTNSDEENIESRRQFKIDTLEAYGLNHTNN